MKKLFILFVLLSFVGYSQTQVTGTDVIAFQGNVTTTIRDAFDVPTGEFWLIYNTTTDQLEVAGDDDVWSAFTAGGADQLGSDLDRGDIVVSGSGTVATIDAGAVDSGKIADGTVTGTDIATSTVTGSNITNSTITAVDLADDSVSESELNSGNAPTDEYVLTYESDTGGFEWQAGSGTDASLSETDQTILTGITRTINTAGTGTVSLSDTSTELLRVGNNNDEAVYVKGLEVLPGGLNTISLVSPVAFPSLDTGAIAASAYDKAIVEDTTDGELYRSNGTVWEQLSNAGGLSSADIDTFAELDAIVADKSLANLDDAQTFTGAKTFSNGLLMSGGSDITMNANNITNTGSISSETVQVGGNGVGADLTGYRFTPVGSTFNTSANIRISSEQSGGGYVEDYTIRWGGVPTQDTDLTDKLYVDTAAAAGGTDDQTAAEVTYDNTISGLVATNAKTAIDETKALTDTNGSGISNLGSDVSTLAAVPASQFGIDVKTVDYTLVANDALDSVLVSLNYNNEAITIPSGVFSEGQSIRLFKHTSATNESRIIEGAGVSLVGFSDGITLGTYPSGATVTRTSSATSPEEWEITDYFGTIADYAAATLGSELLTNGDDFSSGWSYQNGSSATGGVATAIGSGTLISDAGNHVVYQNITALTNGTDYRITITWRRTVGSGDAYVGIKFSAQQTVSGLSASFVEQTFDFTAGASGYDRIAIGAASGTTLEVDSISLKEIL